MSKRTYVLVGPGTRAHFYIDALAGRFRGDGDLLAFCDVSQVRMDYHRERLGRLFQYLTVRTYLADDFDRMLDELKPDVVIVCTTDSTHHEYILRAINKGCDVVCEKPIATDEEKCRQILAAPGLQSRKVRVTFNVRWTPEATKIKELIMQGKIGEVKQVHFDYMINWRHGSGYFSRWHSEKQNSGGLLVHKATHHFDRVNWWIDSIPREVFAMGGLAYFGRENAMKRGEQAWTEYDRYTGKAAGDDPFSFRDLTKDNASTGLYLNAEAESGYIHDRNALRGGIDIEDSLSLLARYRNGVTLNYSLNAFAPATICRVRILGDRGRLDLQEEEAPPAHGESEPIRRIFYAPLFEKGQEIEVERGEGGHGGGDPRLEEAIFSLNPPRDPFGRNAEHEQGIASAILGIAGNRSLSTGTLVLVDDLICLRPEAIRLSELK